MARLIYITKIILTVHRMDCRGKDGNTETNWAPNIFVLVGDNDGAIYCDGSDQGRKKFSLGGEDINQDMLSLNG